MWNNSFQTLLRPSVTLDRLALYDRLPQCHAMVIVGFVSGHRSIKRHSHVSGKMPRKYCCTPVLLICPSARAALFFDGLTSPIAAEWDKQILPIVDDIVTRRSSREKNPTDGSNKGTVMGIKASAPVHAHDSARVIPNTKILYSDGHGGV